MKTVFAILLMLISIMTFSQKKLFISEFIGIGTPIGELKSDGLANTGYLLGVETGYYFTKNIGIGVRFSAINNNVDSDEFQKDVKSEFSDIDYNSLTTQVDNWYSVNIGTGLYSKFNLSKSIIFEAKGIIGLSLAKSPSLEINLYSDYGNFKSEGYSSRSNAFQYIGEIGFKFMLSEKSSLNIQSGISSADHFFSDRYYTQIDTEAPEFSTSNYSKIMTIINTSIGYSLYF